MTHVLLLHARLTPGPEPGRLAPLLARLPYAKLLDLERRDPRARYASLAGLALALRGVEALRGCAAGPGELRFPDGGKPYLTGGPAFSISHGAGRVGVALRADGEVGFDLEEFDPAIREPAAMRARLARWTATESVLKAAGLGLRDARAVELGMSPGCARIGDLSFHLFPVAIADDVIAHVATASPLTAICVEELEASALSFDQ